MNAPKRRAWRPWISLQLLLACLMIVRRSLAFCPSKCRCDADNNLRIECPNAALNVVPIQLNPDVRFINLTRNHIQNVHFTLQFYYGLEVLDLSRNHISTLGARNFESQERLVALNLSENLIAHLGKDVFRGLRRLQTLQLSGNRIVEIDAGAMLDLGELRSLWLANNSVVSLAAGTLRKCVSLRDVDMRQNELLDVPIGNLRGARDTLRRLDLSQNFMQSLGNESFEALGGLEWLDVSGNVLNVIEGYAFGALARLEHLDLADNNITEIPSSQLSHLSHLTYLSISGNNIESLPALAFVNLFQLRELHINRMDQLSHIDARAFVDNTLLQTLSMDDNLGVTVIPHHLYRNNPKLAEIRLRGNSLHSIDASQFPLDQLNRLYLANNPLVCNCSILWLWHLAHGAKLDESSGDAPARVRSTAGTAVAERGQFVLADRANVTCDVWSEEALVRRVVLRELSHGDIECPAYVSFVIAGMLIGLLVVAAVAGGVLRWRVRRRRRRCARERKHIMDRMVVPQPQPDAKMRSEYRDLHQYQQQHQHQQHQQQQQYLHHAAVAEPTQHDDDDDELDHYEQFDDYRYDHRRHVKQPTLFQLGLPPPPSIVYV